MPEKSPIMKYLEFDPLPPKLQEISSPLCLLVKNMESQLPTKPGKSADLTKLPEAKDFFNSINFNSINKG